MKELIEMMEKYELALRYQLSARKLYRREQGKLVGDEFKNRRGRLETLIKKLNVRIDDTMNKVDIIFRAIKLSRQMKSGGIRAKVL